MNTETEMELRRLCDEPEVSILRGYYRWHDRFSNPDAVVRRLRLRWVHDLDRIEFRRAMWEVQPALLSAIGFGVFFFFVWLNILLIDTEVAKVFYVLLGAGFMTWLVGRNWLE
jgi:hypothetical protein